MTISTKVYVNLLTVERGEKEESMQEKLDLCWSNALQDINVFQAVENN